MSLNSNFGFWQAIASSIPLVCTMANIWTTKTTCPIVATNAKAFTIDTNIYVCGGSTTGGVTASVYKYDTLTSTWTQMTSMPAERMGHFCTALNGKGYVICGRNNTNTYQTTCYEYDPVGNAWSTKTTFPGTARWQGFCGAMLNRVYVGGGWNGTTRYSNTFYYDPSNDSWTSANVHKPGPRIQPFNFVINDVLYVGGGQATASNVSDMWAYDGTAWTQKANIGGTATARQNNCQGAANISNGYIVGGYTTAPQKEVFEYDPIANTWAQKAPLSDVIYDGAMTNVGCNIYVATGAYGVAEARSGTFSQYS